MLRRKGVRKGVLKRVRKGVRNEYNGAVTRATLVNETIIIVYITKQTKYIKYTKYTKYIIYTIFMIIFITNTFMNNVTSILKSIFTNTLTNTFRVVAAA